MFICSDIYKTNFQGNVAISFHFEQNRRTSPHFQWIRRLSSGKTGKKPSPTNGTIPTGQKRPLHASAFDFRFPRAVRGRVLAYRGKSCVSRRRKKIDRRLSPYRTWGIAYLVYGGWDPDRLTVRKVGWERGKVKVYFGDGYLKISSLYGLRLVITWKRFGQFTWLPVYLYSRKVHVRRKSCLIFFYDWLGLSSLIFLKNRLFVLIWRLSNKILETMRDFCTSMVYFHGIEDAIIKFFIHILVFKT